MKRFINRANSKISLGNAAALLVFAAMLSQLLGFLRVKLINANFSEFGSQSTDAFFAAFKIPDFFFYTIAAGALGVAFIPVLADHLERRDRKGAWQLATSLLNFMAVCMAVVGVIIIIFAEPLIRLVAPGLTPDQTHTATTIMRIIAFNPLLFTISGIITAVQQTFGRFFFYAIGPLFYNTAIIASIFIFRDNIGLIGLGIGALFGAIIQLLVACIGLYGVGFSYRPSINWKQRDFILTLRRLPPRSIDQGIDSINSIVETNFASKLGAGNITYYENAYTLHTVPIQLVGTTISTAAFPRLSERLAQGRVDLFRRDFQMVLRAIIWIILPIVVVGYFARGYFARLIFAKGSSEIAVIFGLLAGAIFFRTIYAVISRWFYAQKDTVTPLLVSLFAIGLNIFLAYTLSRQTAYGLAGLAMAQSIVAACEVVLLATIMMARDNKLFSPAFWSAIIKIISVTGFSVLAAFIMISLFPLQIADKGFISLGFKLGSIMMVTFTVHVIVSTIFGLEEPRPVIAKLKQIVLKPIRVE